MAAQISDETKIEIPLRNLIAIIAGVAIAVIGYTGSYEPYLGVRTTVNDP